MFSKLILNFFRWLNGHGEKVEPGQIWIYDSAYSDNPFESYERYFCTVEEIDEATGYVKYKGHGYYNSGSCREVDFIIGKKRWDNSKAKRTIDGYHILKENKII